MGNKILRKISALILLAAFLMQIAVLLPAYADNELNLFADSFEADFTSIPVGWYPYAGANNNNVQPSDKATVGAKGVRLSNGEDSYGMGIISSTFDVTPGKEYTAAVDSYTNSGAGRAYLLFYDVSGQVISSEKAETESAEKWETFTLNGVAGEYASKAAILLYINEGISGDICFDNVIVNFGTDVSLTSTGNLAYHRRITNNVKYQNGKWNWQKAVDGALETKFEVSSSLKQESGYFIIDLGAVANINRVTLYEVGNRISRLKIDVSVDNENWTTVAYQSEIGAKKNIDFPLVNARYVKIDVVEADSTFGFYEVEVFNTSSSTTYPQGDPDTAPVTNVTEAEVAQTIPYESDKFHVYLCIGQSNMVGGDDVLWEDRVRTEGVYLLNSVGQWEYAQAGPGDMEGYNRYATTTISNSDPTLGVAGMSPAQSFAMALAPKMNSDTGIGIICQSVSGTSIDEWQKGAGTNLYEAAVSRTKEALENGGVLKGILWAQGEACASREDYLTLLDTFVTSLRSDLGVAAEEAPFIAAGYPVTRAAQNETISKIATVVTNSDYISHIGTETFEGLHFTAISQRVRGVRFAEKILKKVYNIEKTEQELYYETYGEASPIVAEATEIITEEFEKGSGAEDDPYEVSTLGQLYNVKNYPTAHFKQVNNIEEPFKEAIPEFQGVYDGQGYSINLMLTETDAAATSAFVRTLKSGGVLKNIVTKGSVTTSGGAAAGLAVTTETTGAQILDCVNYADITGGLRSGGIAGAVAKGTSVLRCKNYGTVSGGMYTGGIVGTNTLSTLTNCANYGDVSGTTHVGGVAGQHNANEMSQCFNAGEIISSSDVTGGIAGSIRSGSIVNCYNVGEVTGLNPAGIGTFYVGTTSSIKNSYNVSDIDTYRIYGSITVSNPAEYVYQLKGNNTTSLAGITYMELSDMQSLTADQLGDSTKEVWNDETPFPTLKENVPTKTYGVYTVSVTKSGNGTISPSESITIKDGDILTLNIAPLQGDIVESVKLNGVEINGVSAGAQTLYIPSVSQNSNVHITFKSPAIVVNVKYLDGKYTIEFSAEADSCNLYLYTGDTMPDTPTVTGIASGFDITPYLTEATQYKAVVALAEDGKEVLYSAPVIADASFAYGTGTEEDPYHITKIGHLMNVKKYPDKAFIQMADITDVLTEPVTGADVTFSGVYNGNGKILNINFNIRNNSTSTGLFSTVDGGIIKNVVVTGTMTCHGANFGSIVGKMTGTAEILNCTAKVDISVTNAGSVGGIAGLSNATSGLIEGCINEGNINGYSYGLGGIIGNANASTTINKCMNSGNITDTRHAVGGIAGLCSSTVTNSYNLGNVEGTTNAGGLIGHHSGGAVAENCYNLGKVSATNTDGRAAAFTTCNMAKTFTVKQCYNAGEIDSSSKTQDLISYTATAGTVTYEKCYLLTAESLSDISGVTFVSPDTLKTADLGDGYEPADANDSYPYPQIKGNLQETPWDFAKVTVTATDNGISDYTGTKYIKKGTCVQLTLTPDEGKIIEYIVYNGSLTALYISSEYSYTTPEINGEATVKISFNSIMTEPQITTIDTPYVEKTVLNTNSAYVFAAASDHIEGYTRTDVGMLFSPSYAETDVFNLSNSNLTKIVCKSTNAIGQYGVMFTGVKLVGGTYYARPYAEYTDSQGIKTVVYGNIVPFTIE